ncbi:CBU_0592 family membrane protein [Sinomicrobium sp. M5D2P17]
MFVYTIIGWIGAIVFIIAYFLLSVKLISAEKPLYHYLNAIGGVCLVVNALHLSDLPNVVVNVVWTSIALLAVYRIYRSIST